ncbi:cytochrome oxidase assembly protein-like protein [Leishmania guyanensis]|uniref:Putative cytochrome oxidase assembly protein-like protein n=1 Tax=Leishmania guyanensis TaxID=5670 RepID=A0A1E1J0L0_LEIGU|nr:Putative cytochrome oxidase assembly protein-like protein [Leishmania guyanensis]
MHRFTARCVINAAAPISARRLSLRFGTYWAQRCPTRFMVTKTHLSTADEAAATTAAAKPWIASPHNRSVAHWLYLSAACVGGVVWLGGVTRLTESGLSLVEWKPISGVRPPLTDEEWDKEFRHYQEFPEFKQKPNMTLKEFQLIFFWEWAHRLLARSLGLVFGAPLLYYASCGYFKGNGKFLAGLIGILGLGGAQGFMGWYMVTSGLDSKLLEERRKATVSAYRLAAHLILAFTIYSFMLRMGYGLKLPAMAPFPRMAKVQLWSRLSFATMFATAISGAFVAGLDAGLLYNDEFPWMAGGIFPPADHLFTLEPTWRNFFENHSMVQTTHRIMAGTTFLTIMGLNLAASRRRGFIPPSVFRSLMFVNTALLLQISLGVGTVMSTVYVPIAVSHQMGALVLLTTLIRLCSVVGSRGFVLA